MSDPASDIARTLHRRRRTVATAESVTCGTVAKRLGAAPDSSDWLRGGVVAYASAVKFDVLGVAPGPVITETCAREMAVGAAHLLAADYAVSTTGAGGPGSQEGRPAGTVFIAVTSPSGCRAREYHFEGDPADVVEAATEQALRDLRAAISEADRPEPALSDG
jgi:nicotinamide-nucleotide amidase